MSAADNRGANLDPSDCQYQNSADRQLVSGGFAELAGERFYAIRNVDRMAPFFASVVSSDDHWLFASSTGGLTAGRVSPGTALFPYLPVDKVEESATHTGSRTLLRVRGKGSVTLWEPFNRERDGGFTITRNLYKNILGNKLCFEEINHDLRLAFRYTWMTSREYGFVRSCELENLGALKQRIDLLDGLLNVLPAGTPPFTQTNFSNLVDAYKWNELDPATGLALMTLYSTITDRAEPSESLKATVVYSIGLDQPVRLLSAAQIDAFRHDRQLRQEVHKRGIRGAYLVSSSFELPCASLKSWRIVADTERTQRDVVALRQALRNPAELGEAISRSIDSGTDSLAKIIGSCDGFQATAEENVTVHHYANVLYNVLRGGYFFDQYTILASDFVRTIRHFNLGVYERHRSLLESLPERLGYDELQETVAGTADPQLSRLTREYLPLTFGRRHGDPSRPWNQFAIRLKDEHGNDLLSYEGNWRDIFQNWEALAISFPLFVESMIAKFVNASTVDGYNPYRITKEGIDWEVEEPHDPWSYIGYWGDHQVIYLLKLLELSSHFQPNRLQSMLRLPWFSYANVPYRIKSFGAILANPKHTVIYDDPLAGLIAQRVAELGADGKLVRSADGEIWQVNLLEKLLVPLLSKLGNLVIDGGIWLNTQRPEWNDANNAIVGNGLSMVTLAYMRRYVLFFRDLLANEDDPFTLSAEVGDWLAETAAVLARLRGELGGGPVSGSVRYEALVALGEVSSRYREAVYALEGFSGTGLQDTGAIRGMLDDALAAIDHSIGANRREDGLFHAYNLAQFRPGALEIRTLYLMLEGQVAALTSGALPPAEVVKLLEALFASEIYRADQDSFLLYPDRKLPGFLEKNRLDAAEVEAVPLLRTMLAKGDARIVLRDADGDYRFSAEFRNAGDLHATLDALVPEYGDEVAAARPALDSLYEAVFNHKAFTGRSGTMFAFEGLGSIYWHMVAKLLLAAQENFFAALDQRAEPAVCQRLGEFYYRIRAGIGFNKSPAEYGAFPTDPYSHTPRHVGASQPGMTGQVKEEIITRWGELGLRVAHGVVRFEPALLRPREFAAGGTFRYLDVRGAWQTSDLPASSLAFTCCQVPIVYRLDDTAEPSLTVIHEDGGRQVLREFSLPADVSNEIFRRSGRIRRLELVFRSDALFAGQTD